ncbi:sodium/potassium-transporting ATPase subunit beta-2-like [Stegodyphus dumicola]|uniref:sodium/potassium-transporting ATPase subunit beta-2-like n=1 Tax=Stegodyphus dumicola TaxID=202533 RepID=UPI0015B00B4B|nr:sodium/potassium-transporting ATPase subunit beta-2-like [Stegodyphus dumicola]XP_035213514.1 sodium/potassium-transporting ATPase subunit beta-2-like [Stegodyphus dumicola]
MEDKGGNTYKMNEEETKWQSFKKVIWNSETKECFGRTGLSWFKITIFYIIFYACLAAFWTCMLVVFYQTLENDQPKWKLDSSRIGSSPGLGFRPSPPDENIDSTLIWFNATRNETVKYWVDNLNDYLSLYKTHDTGNLVQTCRDGQMASSEKVCHVPILTGKEQSCSPERQFGYPEGKPCVLIKLNRIYDWVPESYNEAPPKLAEHLKKEFKKDLVYITCVGENSADKDNIGDVEYYPAQGIEFKYFPFLNQKGYMSPFVFVQFANINRGVLVNIECRAWAKNIVYDRGDRLGSVHFELLVD